MLLLHLACIRFKNEKKEREICKKKKNIKEIAVHYRAQTLSLHMNMIQLTDLKNIAREILK